MGDIGGNEKTYWGALYFCILTSIADIVKAGVQVQNLGYIRLGLVLRGIQLDHPTLQIFFETCS